MKAAKAKLSLTDMSNAEEARAAEVEGSCGGDAESLLASSQAEPADEPQARAAAKPPSWCLAQVLLRMPKAKRTRLHQIALGLDKSLQQLVLDAVDDYLERRGFR